MPYLIDLKQNFTQYAISDIMELNSKYTLCCISGYPCTITNTSIIVLRAQRGASRSLRHPSISMQNYEL
ncbi:replication initiation protein [Enterococcus saigonensis]|uniref:replication initiation protein n=1 Tax=Enterococcus saigonensis TaxID=1805431 RepID=UPI002F9660BD